MWLLLAFLAYTLMPGHPLGRVDRVDDQRRFVLFFVAARRVSCLAWWVMCE